PDPAAALRDDLRTGYAEAEGPGRLPLAQENALRTRRRARRRAAGVPETKMYRASDGASGIVVAEHLRSAHTHWARLRGLLGTSGLAPGEGLWIRPCRQVHMFGMRYPIDVVFLDERLGVVHAIPSLAPWAVSPRIGTATSVIELPAGTLARAGVGPGAQLVI